MSELSIALWHKFGKHRLYVNDADGTAIGWHDLTTGESTIITPAAGARCTAAIEAALSGDPELRTRYRVQPAAAAAVPVPQQREPAPEAPWTDLAHNVPGASLRALAVTERQAAPLRTTVARVLGVHTQERAWRVGGRGECLVAAQLAKLGATWRVLHSVPVGSRGSDIDHVVIGPGGVYTVNSKHHADADVWVGGSTVLVKGARQPYVRNSVTEADRAARLLGRAYGRPVPVVGLVAIVARRLTVKAQPDGGRTFVLARREIRDWLERRGPVLSEQEVAAIFEQARRSTTWTC